MIESPPSSNPSAGAGPPVGMGDWPRDCGVVIPCLNEAAAIGPLLLEVRQHLPAIVVVDDGSTDGTAAAASAAGARVLRHPAPRGKGAALRTGLTALSEQGCSWALLMDGDGQHAAADIPRFLSRAADRRVHLLVGNRMANAQGMPWLRRVANRWMSARLSRISGQALPDSQCGFRLMNLDAWAQVELTTSHFEIDSELLLAFLERGYAVEFLPIRVIYGAEQTKINAWRDGWRWLAWLSRLRRQGRGQLRQKPLHSTVTSSKLAL